MRILYEHLAFIRDKALLRSDERLQGIYRLAGILGAVRILDPWDQQPIRVRALRAVRRQHSQFPRDVA